MLRSTGSIGASLLLWSTGAIIAISGILTWLELGLSIPKYAVPTAEPRHGKDGEPILENVPSSGGEKNYVRYSLFAPAFYLIVGIA